MWWRCRVLSHESFNSVSCYSDAADLLRANLRPKYVRPLWNNVVQPVPRTTVCVVSGRTLNIYRAKYVSGFHTSYFPFWATSVLRHLSPAVAVSFLFVRSCRFFECLSARFQRRASLLDKWLEHAALSLINLRFTAWTSRKIAPTIRPTLIQTISRLLWDCFFLSIPSLNEVVG